MEKEKQELILNLLSTIKNELNIDFNKEQDSKEQDKKLEKDQKNSNQELSNIEKLEIELNNLIQEINRLEEEKMLALADKQNIVRRFQNESVLIRKYGGEKLASELIPAIDMFRGVLNSSSNNPEIKNYLLGFEMIINQIDQALANAGVTMFEVKPGDEFDPLLHCALEQVKSEEFSSNRIVHVISNGYKLHDRVIKHASVKVAE